MAATIFVEKTLIVKDGYFERMKVTACEDKSHAITVSQITGRDESHASKITLSREDSFHLFNFLKESLQK
jgi:hypothetical protein